MLGHTRWASVGIISEANAHPLNQEELDGHERPYVVGALNGDVDNYADLKALEGLQVPAEITTDAKVIPALVARRIGERRHRAGRVPHDGVGARGLDGHRRPDRRRPRPPAPVAPGQRPGPLRRASPRTPSSWPASRTAWWRRRRPTCAWTARRRPTPSAPPPPAARSSCSTPTRAGTLDGISGTRSTARRCRCTSDELQHAEITTRDIDRGEFPHFLLKEISEAPASFRKTLRGKVVERDGRLTVDARHRDAARVAAGAPARRQHPPRRGHRSGHRRDRRAEPRRGAHHARRRHACAPTPSSPPSSAVSSCATTCPTRSWSRSARAAPPPTPTAPSDLARARGAAVLAIVNRRNSDLVDKSDGVLYTSDGRDVEMAVPSTKAFYAQIAAGYLLAVAIADELAPTSRRRRGARDPRRAPGAARRDDEGARTAVHDRGDRATARGVAPLLGRGRQRSQPHRRRRGAGEGLGALLQVDLVRLDRGQEAHRPLGRAVGARVRGGAAGLQRRRRRQGDRHLPGAPGRADRDRHRG